jgi:protein required for attachment to host cells
MKAKRTWVLIADGAKARILENLGPSKGLHQVAGLEEDLKLPPNRELLADRPGRSFESKGATRHSYETSDPHRAMKCAFAEHVMVKLAAHYSAGKFDQLVLVAPAATLGDLRAAIDHALARAIAGELARDLTHVPTNEIGAHLGAIIVV